MIFSVSIDLDGLGCYAAIHGLPAAGLSERNLRAVPEQGLSRLCEVLESSGIACTIFAIGRELREVPGAAQAVARAARAGHEIASHSDAHDYGLSRLSPAAIDRDLAAAEVAIAQAVGRAPRGFRAPGYTLSPALLAVLRARGVAYDSSLLPSPPYYAAKAGALAWMRLRGRPGQSILGDVRQLAGARGPHWRSGVRELPIATLPAVRFPVIGTTALAMPAGLASRLIAASAAGGHVNLELHGIDALDSTDPIPATIADRQPGASIPAGRKLARLRALLRDLRARGEPRTLESAARELLAG